MNIVSCSEWYTRRFLLPPQDVLKTKAEHPFNGTLDHASLAPAVRHEGGLASKGEIHSLKVGNELGR